MFRDGLCMNELVIMNYSLKRALNSSFKWYDLALREGAKAHVLIPSRGANGMVSNGRVILSATPASQSSNLKTCPSPCNPCITVPSGRISSSECSTQRQVLDCKRRNLGCSSVEGRSSTANSGTKAAVLLGI